MQVCVCKQPMEYAANFYILIIFLLIIFVMFHFHDD